MHSLIQAQGTPKITHIVYWRLFPYIGFCFPKTDIMNYLTLRLIGLFILFGLVLSAQNPDCATCDNGAPPLNDICEGAIDWGELEAVTTDSEGYFPNTFGGLSNICATTDDSGQYLDYCISNNSFANPSASVWYQFSILGTGLEFSLSSGLSHVNIALWQGEDCGNLTAIGCYSSSDGNLSTVFYNLSSGNYYLQLGGANLADQCDDISLILSNIEYTSIPDGLCLGQNYEVSLDPMPLGSQYEMGDNVEFCFEVLDFIQISSSWIHGVVVEFGEGWESISPGTPPSSCTDSTNTDGYWGWYESVTAVNSIGQTFGNGFYYESSVGSSGTNDDPGNNYGDNDVGNSCTLTFCWDLVVGDPCEGSADLGMNIQVLSDGQSGVWNTESGCQDEPISIYLSAVGSDLTIWYQDLDGDGLGNSAVSQLSCNQPIGFVMDNTDLDDVCDGIVDECGVCDGEGIPLGACNCAGDIELSWYQDLDGDGLGNINESILSCEQPNGYVLDNSDEEDLCDGVVDVCGVCDGTGMTTWYQDLDGDGYGNSLADSIMACLMPLNYVINNLDEDDNCFSNEFDCLGVCDGNYQINSCGDCLAPFDPDFYCCANVEISIDILSTTNATCTISNGGVEFVPASGGLAPYTYTVGNVTQSTTDFNQLAASDYTIIVEDSGGCQNSFDFSIGLNEPVIEIESEVVHPSAGEADGSISLVTNDSGSIFYFLDGEFQVESVQEVTFDNLAAGTYEFEVVNIFGCSNFITITLSAPVSIEENQAIQFQSYPNPASDILYIEGDFRPLKMIGIDGRVYENWTFHHQELDISNLPNGVYHLKGFIGDVVVEQKIIIMR